MQFDWATDDELMSYGDPPPQLNNFCKLVWELRENDKQKKLAGITCTYFLRFWFRLIAPAQNVLIR